MEVFIMSDCNFPPSSPPSSPKQPYGSDSEDDSSVDIRIGGSPSKVLSRNESAIIIQRNFRTFLAKKSVFSKRSHQIDAAHNLFRKKLEQASSIEIQRVWRGHQSRKELKEASL